MALDVPGIYLIKNRKTGLYIIENDDPVAGEKVSTQKIGVGEDVPQGARISVASVKGGYSLKSNSGLFIADCGKTEGGKCHLVWESGEHGWVIQAATPDFWNIGVPSPSAPASKFAGNDSVGSNVILMEKRTIFEAHWEFFKQDE